jgi:hypothetical protein
MLPRFGLCRAATGVGSTRRLHAPTPRNASTPAERVGETVASRRDVTLGGHNAVPFLDLLTAYGSPWAMREGG